MDKYDKHKYDSEEPHNYNSTSHQSFNHHHNRNSPRNYRGGGGAVAHRDHQKAYDSTQTYPLPPGGGGGGAGIGLGITSDGDVFQGCLDGSGGSRIMGRNSDDSRGFRGWDAERCMPVGSDGRGFGPTMGGDGGGYQTIGRNRSDSGDGGGVGFRPIGGDSVGYRTVGHDRGNGGEFRPLGGAGGFRPIGSDFSSISADGLDYQPTAIRAGGFQPMVGGGSFGGDTGRESGLESYEVKRPPLTGQKRGYSFFGVDRSQERGTSFAKLFVGSVPRTATEDDIRPMFDKHGCVLEVALIRDKRTGQQQGCCFVKYASSEEADGAIRALHNKYVLPGGVGPIQVRYADGERERLGAAEYKLFIGSLNKQASEKEIEEIFLTYGSVEDVYLMRDENKQSRGCGFVKYAQREMAQAAINALNGRYTMRGCDMPLTVRFADPKRPRPGEPRLLTHGGPPHGYASTTSWPSVSSEPFGPSSYAGDHGLANQFPTISTSTSGPIDDFHGGANGTRPAPTVSLAQGSKSGPQFDAKMSSIQKPLQSSQQQFQPPHIQSSIMPPGQIQASYSATQAPYGPVQSSQRQSTVAQPQLSSTTGRPLLMDNQQRPTQLSPSQLAQMLSRQKQTLQATFQSSQQALNELQQQVMQLKPSNQNLSGQQGALAERQQSPWAGVGSQSFATTADTTVSPAVATVTPAVAAANCNWTEHVSPDGYKYYYNCMTGESKWEKPEELVSYEQQKQLQQKPSSQRPPVQSHPSGSSLNRPAPHVQTQFYGQYQGDAQNQIGPLEQQASQSSLYQPLGITANQNQKEFGYSQIPAGRGHVSDPSRNQQGVQASQEWMWKK